MPVEDLSKQTTDEKPSEVKKGLDDLNKELKSLILDLKKSKNKKEKKELSLQISVLKKEINSLIKAESKAKKNISKKKVKKIKVVSFQLEKREFKSSLLKSMKPYSTKRKRFIIPMIICMGLATSLATFFFIQGTGLFSMGVTGILQGFARLTKAAIVDPNTANIVYNVMFWLLYFFFNIPLLIFAYYKISKKFCLYTFAYICTSQIFGLILGFIPGLNEIHLFGDLGFEFKDNPKCDVYLLSWNVINNLSVLPLFFYAGAQGIVLGGCYSLLYMVGSSTGGTDIIAFYYGKVKNTSISKLLLIFNTASIVLSCIIGTIAPAFVDPNVLPATRDAYFGSASRICQSIFSPNLMFSILVAFISSTIVGILFPKNKVLKINVYSQKVEEIKNKLFAIGYQHSLSINNTIGGYSWTAEQNIETICLYFELPEIVACIREVDQDALIVTQKITDIDGKVLVVSR